MSVRLVDIIGVAPDWETRHRVRALEVDGKSRALAGLLDLRKWHEDDYKKIMKVIRLVAENDRVINENHVKRSRKHPDVYEMRGGNARLFFFYLPTTEEVVVCTNVYWKAKASRREQDEAFERCSVLRTMFLDSVTT